MALDRGQVVDGHTLLEKIGEGGNGEVWKAEYLGDTVALKFLPPDAAHSHARQALAQYKLGRLEGPEGRFFPRVEHVNLDGPSPYMRMEFLSGDTLEEHLKAHPELRSSERISIARRVLEALAAVHKNGFIHGDLSPRNVIVGPDSSIRLIDVGIGTTAPREDVRLSASSDRPLGVAAPLYAAPERFTGAFADRPREADVYSFGKLFYHVMTSEDPVAIKPLSKRFPELDSRWDDYIYLCLESHPDRRFPDARAALEAFPARPATALFRAACVSCSAPLEVPRSLLGRDVDCPRCGESHDVFSLDIDARRAYVRPSAPEMTQLPAGARDYTGKALLAFFLFFFFWFPGAVATAAFFAQAREEWQNTGQRPAGMGALEVFLWLFVYAPIGLVGFALLAGLILRL